MVKKETSLKKDITKKEKSKKTTEKKTVTSSKKTTKEKVETVEEPKIVEVKKEKKIKKIGAKISKFLNNPKPIIIILSIICLLFVYSFANYKTKYKVYLGEVDSNDITISKVQIVMNPSINMFQGFTATYSGEAKEVYSYQIGYFYKVNGEYKEFMASEQTVTSPLDLADIINRTSSTYVLEYSKNVTYFTTEVKKHLKDLHFIVKASTNKDDTDNYDIVLDCPINLAEYD